MQLVAKCRTIRLSLSVKDILKSDTIAQLAFSVKSMENARLQDKEEFDRPFNVTPIQRLYFERLRDHSQDVQPLPFTQEYLLGITKFMSVQDMVRCIELIVDRHSLLRARFAQTPDGQWTQRVSRNTVGTYHFDHHEISDRNEMVPICKKTHNALDLMNGPVFSGDFFNMGGEQLLFLVAHDAVFDVMSWRIIFKDLETLLIDGTMPLERPLSFQTWTIRQEEYALQHLTPQKSLPCEVFPSDYAYWEMENAPNITRDQVISYFDIDQNTLQSIFNHYRYSLRADHVDVYVASMLQSFHSVFTVRDSWLVHYHLSYSGQRVSRSRSHGTNHQEPASKAPR